MLGVMRKSLLMGGLAVAFLAGLVGCGRRDGGSEGRVTVEPEPVETSVPIEQPPPADQRGQSAQDQPTDAPDDQTDRIARSEGSTDQEPIEPSEQPVPFDRESEQPSASTAQRPAQRGQPSVQPGSEEPQAEPEPRAEAARPSDEAPLIQGTVRGTVRSIDLARGSVTIESAGQQADLQAHPSDLSRMEPGDTVELSFASHADGSQWLEPSTDARELLQSSESVGQISAQVEAVDEDAGIVAVGGETFRAHPQQLAGLSPGESVSLSYAEIGDTAWVAELEPQGAVASAEPQPGQQPGQPLDEEHTASDIDWIFESQT